MARAQRQDTVTLYLSGKEAETLRAFLVGEGPDDLGSPLDGVFAVLANALDNDPE